MPFQNAKSIPDEIAHLDDPDHRSAAAAFMRRAAKRTATSQASAKQAGVTIWKGRVEWFV
jgi:hypothetical protein